MSDEQATQMPPDQAASAPGSKRASRRKKIIAIAVGVVVVGAGAKLFLLTPASSADTCPTPTTTAPLVAPAPPPSTPAPDAAAEAAECPPEPGPVLKLDPVMINLADGRYLQLGLALQLTVGTDLKLMTEESGGGARALDAAVAIFGAKSYDALVAPASREAAKRDLARIVVAAYDDTVLDIYFTSFVMQ